MISPRMAKFINILPKVFVEGVCKMIVDGYLKKYAHIEVNGMENLEGVKEPILFICNHLSNSDALVIDKVLKNKDITFIAGVKLSNNPITNIGMNITKTISIKPNTADKDAISKVVKASKAGKNILVFPEGTRSRNGNMIEGKKGVVLIQKLTKATIIPLGICGTDKLMPIEADMSLEKFQDATVVLNIGKPLQMPKKQPEEDKHQYDEKTLDFMMRKIAELIPKERRGVYK